jgi:hypothetical protein
MFSWWNKRHKSPSTKTLDSNNFPAQIEVIPNRLAVTVYLHDFKGRYPSWTYVTSGLQKMNQPEVSITLLRKDNIQFPDEPLKLILELYSLAEQGRIVHAGGTTQFGPRKFYNNHLAYIPAHPIEGVSLPPDAIMAISVTEEELGAIHAFGILRFMARLGRKMSYFPCPPWLDTERTGLSFGEIHKNPVRDLQKYGILSVVRCIRCTQVRILKVDEWIVLRLSRRSQSCIAEALAQFSEKECFALLTELDADADGCLVWESGQKEPTAIMMDGRQDVAQLCGCFVVWMPEQETSDSEIIEDGFLVKLTAKIWSDIRNALMNGQPFSVTSDKLSFQIEWDFFIQTCPPEP